MREILFRGLASNKKFVYGLYVQNAFDGTSRNVAHGIQSAGCYPVEINSNTLGQYTGLKDCNGVKIFEGDIIYLTDEIFAVVAWNDGTCSFCALYKDGSKSDHLYGVSMAKVIGNIHQNPELLEHTNANHN